MKKSILIVLVLMFSALIALSGNDSTGSDISKSNGVISGQVVDKLTGEGLSGVKISFSDGTEMYTDLNGNFEVTVSGNNNYQIQTNYISYETYTIANLHINAGEKQMLRVEMKSLED